MRSSPPRMVEVSAKLRHSRRQRDCFRGDGVRSILWAALAAIVALCPAAHAASPPAPPPLEAYGRLPAIDMVELSPSGERFALVARQGEQRMLYVRRASGEPIAVMPLGQSKVREIQWAGEDQLLVFGTDTLHVQGLVQTKQEWLGALHVDLRTGKSRRLLQDSRKLVQAIFGWYGVRQVDGRWHAYIGALTYEQFQPTFSGGILRPSLYRIDLETGRASLVDDSRKADVDWLVSAEGQVAARLIYEPRDRTYRLHDGERGASMILERAAPGGDDRVSLGGLGRTSGSLLLLESVGGERVGREVFPTSGGEGEVVFGDAGDEVRPLYDRTTHLLIGSIDSRQGSISLLDPHDQRRVDAARKAFPGLNTALASYAESFDRMVVLTDGQSDSGTYWLVDIAKKSAVPIGRVRPQIPDDQVGPMRLESYRAADGLQIEAVLTLPPGRSERALPLVVLPHGGPMVSGDKATFDWWAQAFASRGYAVLQPNFRGTLGYGDAFRLAAYGELGRKMQTDLSDGVAALAARGVVDPARVCIVGASYGGYAALAGVTLQQQTYRCAVSVAGLADLSAFTAWMSSRSGEDRRAVTFFQALTGTAGRRDLKEISPADQAERADAPILLIHGEDDVVVPIDQSRSMERALRRAGKPVELVVMKSEDHWLSKEETRLQMLSAAVAFVEKHNPAR